MPSEATLAGWRARAAPRFVACLKAPATVTHEAPGSEASLDALRTFLSRATRALGPSLGPVLLQFPRSVGPSLPLLQALGGVVDGVSAVGGGAPIQIALEVRHAGWLKPASGLREWLDARPAWALVAHPNSLGHATVVAPERTGASPSYGLEPLDAHWPCGGFAYARLHGDNDEHTFCYTDAQLRPLAAVLHGWRMRGREVFAFILSDDGGAAMPRNAERLKQLVHALAGEEPPRAPKAPRTLSSFFGGAAAKKQKPA